MDSDGSSKKISVRKPAPEAMKYWEVLHGLVEAAQKSRWRLTLLLISGIASWGVVIYVAALAIQATYSAISHNPTQFFDQPLFFTLVVSEIPIAIVVDWILRRGRRSKQEEEELLERISKAVAEQVIKTYAEERRKDSESRETTSG